MDRSGLLRHGFAVQAWPGQAGLGAARPRGRGAAGPGAVGSAGPGGERRGRASRTWLGAESARLGRAGPASASRTRRRGASAGRGKVRAGWLGFAVLAGFGSARQGPVCPGRADRAWAGQVCSGWARLRGSGMALRVLVVAGRGWASRTRRGMARHGGDWRGLARPRGPGAVWRGRDGRGLARLAWVRPPGHGRTCAGLDRAAHGRDRKAPGCLFKVPGISHSPNSARSISAQAFSSGSIAASATTMWSPCRPSFTKARWFARMLRMTPSYR